MRIPNWSWQAWSAIFAVPSIALGGFGGVLANANMLPYTPEPTRLFDVDPVPVPRGPLVQPPAVTVTVRPTPVPSRAQASLSNANELPQPTTPAAVPVPATSASQPPSSTPDPTPPPTPPPSETPTPTPTPIIEIGDS